MKYFSNT
jgi:hypothetical protein